MQCQRERELYKQRMTEKALRSYAALQAQDELRETNEVAQFLLKAPACCTFSLSCFQLHGSGTMASCREIEEDFM